MEGVIRLNIHFAPGVKVLVVLKFRVCIDTPDIQTQVVFVTTEVIRSGKIWIKLFKRLLQHSFEK